MIRLSYTSRLAPFAAFAWLSLLAGPSQAYPEGPPDERAGDPPALETCHSVGCHASFPVNSGNGSLTVQGVPASYLPGTSYVLTVQLNDPDQRRWGFEATVLRPTLNTQAGTVEAIDPAFVQVSDQPGTQKDYVKQTLEGSFAGQEDDASWQFRWTAPSSGTGAAHLYVAGNAANNNGFPTGDYVYTFNVLIPETDPTAVGDAWPVLAGNLRILPNPVSHGGAELRLMAGPAGEARVNIVDMTGRLVRSLHHRASAGESVSLHWDGRDETGRDVVSGVYYATLAGAGASLKAPIVVIR